MIAGGAPKNLMPSAPRSFTRRSQARPCSGVWMSLQHVVHGREIAVGEQPGRGDGVRRRALLLVDHPVEPVDRAHLAHRGHAMREPQLVDVVDRRHPAVRRVIGDAGMARGSRRSPASPICRGSRSRGRRARAGCAAVAVARRPSSAGRCARSRPRCRSGPIGGAPVPSMTVALRSTMRWNGPMPRSRPVAG